MNTKIKQLTLLATAGLLLAACGQGKKEESTQATTQATTTAPTTQVASNKQEATEALPKDGQATYKYEEKGASSTLTYYFKDDIVYKQEAIYTYNPKELGKTDEEVGKFLEKREALIQVLLDSLQQLRKEMVYTFKKHHSIILFLTGRNCISVIPNNFLLKVANPLGIVNL